MGVFVNEDPERIAGLAESGVLDYIQLHGDEDGEEIRWIKDTTGKPVIKAVRVRSREDILQAEKLPCEYLLLDTYKAGEYGGSGVGLSIVKAIMDSMNRDFGVENRDDGVCFWFELEH